MNRHILAVGAAALALAACQKQAASTAANDTAVSTADAASSTPPDSTAVSSATAVPAAAPAPAAADFVAMAATSDMYEIQAAKIAEKRSKNADVKAFAKMMIADHSKSTAMVKKAVAASGKPITPPTDLPADKKAMLDALNSASAADFDKTYVDQQVTAHKDALAFMTGYSMSGDTPQLKDAAGMIAPTVQMHLDKITAIQAGLSK
jgi:putative membrane protein